MRTGKPQDDAQATETIMTRMLRACMPGIAAVLTLGAPAMAQQPVTVPPATAPASIPTEPAAVPAAPAVQAAAPASVPVTSATVAADPLTQPAMPSAPTATVTTTGLTPGIASTNAAGAPPETAPGAVTAPGLAGTAPAVTTPPANMPQGTPAVVNQVMQNLKTSEKNISVEDMSKAEDALARLDLLLQIEKKVGEIKKAQDDRDTNGPGMSPGAAISQVPASALVLPNAGMTPGMGGALPAGMSGMGGMSGGSIIHSAPAGGGNYEIEQISGTNGNYSAILTTPDGDRKTVRAGDKLDGRTVSAINLDGIELSGGHGKKNKMLTIKNEGVLLSPTMRE